MNITDALRKQVDQIAPLPHGTVVRYTVEFSITTLTYTALMVKGQWYLSGEYRNKRILSNGEFLTAIAQGVFRDVCVATEWEEL